MRGAFSPYLYNSGAARSQQALDTTTFTYGCILSLHLVPEGFAYVTAMILP